MKDISIIIPCYNVQDYITDCIEDLENRLRECNSLEKAEIIMIDDGSKDSTYEKCLEINEKYANTKTVFYCENGVHINRGLVGARNYGLKNASGKWILFLDADDYLEKGALELFFKEQNRDVDIIVSGFSYYNKSEIIYEVCANIETREYDTKEFLNKLFDIVSLEQFSCIGGKLYRRSFIENNNLMFRNEYLYNEDLAFITEAVNHVDKIFYINKSTYKYIKRMDSITFTYRPRVHYSISKVYSLLENMLNENGIKEKSDNISELRVRLVRMSLKGDCSFSGKEAYSNSFKEIRKMNILNQKIRFYLSNKKIGKFDKIVVFLIKVNLPDALYTILKKKSFN